MIGTTRNTSIATATALATGQSRLAKNSFHNTRPIIAASGPPSISGMTNSPTAGMNTRPHPAMMPGSESGSVIDANTRQGGAPRSAAASFSVRSRRSSAAYSGNTMNGRYE